MKLGLTALITAAAVLPGLLAQDFYMLSVFILGVNVGRVDDYPNLDLATQGKQPRVKMNTGGKVRFRAIVFKSLEKPKSTKPSNKDVKWGAHGAHDFEFTFEQLQRKFVEKFFNAFSISTRIGPGNLPKENYYKEIKKSSFNINVFGVELETRSTHLASMVTNYDISRDVNISVLLEKEMQFHFFRDRAPLKNSVLNFRIGPNFLPTEQCTKTGTKPKFKLETEKVLPEEVNRNIAWKDVEFKIQPSFVDLQGYTTKLIPFKTLAKDKVVGATLVLNGVPLRRLSVNKSSKFSLSHDFPFAVRRSVFVSDRSESIYPFDASKPDWVLSPVPSLSQIAIGRYENKNLITKWLLFEEAISMTLHFDCLKLLV